MNFEIKFLKTLIFSLLVTVLFFHAPTTDQPVTHNERSVASLDQSSCVSVITHFLDRHDNTSGIVEDLVKDANLVRVKDWRMYPGFDPEIDAFVKKVLNLNPNQREEFLEKIGMLRPSIESRTKNLIHLLAYDQASWKDYIKFLANHGDFIGFLSNSFIVVFKKMPEELKAALLPEIMKYYAKASKAREIGRGIRMDAPKRTLDLILRYIIPPEEIIENQIKLKKSAVEAYEFYLRENSDAFKEIKEIAKYDYEDSITIYRHIQNFISNVSGLTDEEREIIVFGSFPMGKANIFNPKSDVDFYYPGGKNVESFFPQLKKQIQQSLQLRYPEAKLDISGHLESDYPAIEAARVSNIQIKITPKSIKLLVFPKMIIETLSNTYPNLAPTVYVLE